uniref:Cell surface receptor IPT/TIG domain protein n=1 Tax=Solibacter usitatus (strain Ellin6076) TaxID=234267 RepID=Q01V12_SOLUE
MPSTLGLLRTTALILCAPAWLAAQQSPPTLTAITPSAAYPGTTLTVTLTGTNFLPGTTVESGTPYITVSNVIVVSTTQITATFTITADGVGSASVSGTSGGVTGSGRVCFTIKRPPVPPAIGSLTPARGNRGASGVKVTIAGVGFTPEMTATINNLGVAIDSLEAVSKTWAYLGLTIAPNAAPGPANLTLTTVAGTSAPVVFTINTPAPTLASVTPAVGAQGTDVPVTLSGTNFFAGATVSSSNPGIAVKNVLVVSETQITAIFTIASNAALGNASVTVTTSGGTSGAAAFAVNPAAPTLTSVSPATGVQGTSVPVTLSGTNFVSGTTVATSNAGITVGNVTAVSTTQATATFTIAANAAVGAVGVTVTKAGGTSAPAAFTVNAVAPSVTSMWPTSGPPGTAVIVTGAHFGPSQGASTVTFNGVNAGAAGSWSDTSITVTVPSGANTGNLVVTVGGVASNGVLFTAGTPPSITTLWPTSGPVGTAVTITGANSEALKAPARSRSAASVREPPPTGAPPVLR